MDFSDRPVSKKLSARKPTSESTIGWHIECSSLKYLARRFVHLRFQLVVAVLLKRFRFATRPGCSIFSPKNEVSKHAVSIENRITRLGTVVSIRKHWCCFALITHRMP